jgi:hypothetical protein
MPEPSRSAAPDQPVEVMNGVGKSVDLDYDQGSSIERRFGPSLSAALVSACLAASPSVAVPALKSDSLRSNKPWVVRKGRPDRPSEGV